MANNSNNEAVCLHSTPDKDYIIFSGAQGKSKQEDNTIDINVRALLNSEDIPFKEIKGRYRGFTEASYIVPFEYAPIILDIAEELEQQSVLILTNHKHGLYKARLKYIGNKEDEDIGFLRSTDKDAALAQDSYSYRPDTDTYFITTPTDDTCVADCQRLGYRS